MKEENFDLRWKSLEYQLLRFRLQEQRILGNLQAHLAKFDY